MMNKNIPIVFGCGGHARVILSILGKLAEEVLFVLPDSHLYGPTEKEFFQQIDSFREREIYIGIGHSEVREGIFKRLIENGIKPTNCISSHSFVADGVVLGQGVVICPNAVLMTGVRIGDNCIINTGVIVEHDTQVGDHSHLSSSVTVGSRNKIGRNCFMGVRSCTIPDVSIGEFAVIMAGSVVVSDIPPHFMAGGFPAKPLGRPREQDHFNSPSSKSTLAGPFTFPLIGRGPEVVEI